MIIVDFGVVLETWVIGVDSGEIRRFLFFGLYFLSLIYLERFDFFGREDKGKEEFNNCVLFISIFLSIVK